MLSMAVLSTLSQFFMGQISIRHCKHVGCLRATKNYEVSISKFKLDFVQKYDCVLIFASIGHTSIKSILEFGNRYPKIFLLP